MSSQGASAFVPDVDRMFADIEVLASPEMTGRLTGTPGNEAALSFVEARFEALGLEPGGTDGTYRHHFDFLRWTLNAAPAVSVDGVELEVAVGVGRE